MMLINKSMVNHFRDIVHIRLYQVVDEIIGPELDRKVWEDILAKLPNNTTFTYHEQIQTNLHINIIK